MSARVLAAGFVGLGLVAAATATLPALSGDAAAAERRRRMRDARAAAAGEEAGVFSKPSAREAVRRGAGER